MKATRTVLSPLRLIITGACLLGAVLSSAFADAVTDWNTAFENSLILPPASPNERGPAVPSRPWAIMHAAMFDAVNGIARKYEKLHVTDTAPWGANAEAAAIQAAYTVLSALRPNSQAAWDAQLTTSLATLPSNPSFAQSITRGRDWGTTVANAIIAWRAADNSTPSPPQAPFVGITNVGFWRHSSNAVSPTAGYANLVTVPFLLADPMAFDPGPPYGFANRADALASAAYAADVNESILSGGATSSVRTAAETDEALFNNACDLASLNHLLRSQLSPQARLVDNARAFALLNMSWFDTSIVLFRVKYLHQFWRPFQAINNADLDNNAATTKPMVAWTSFRPTPPHPEYISAHVTLFTTLLRVTARLAGDYHSVNIYAAANPVPHTYDSLAAISDTTVDARVHMGFHFRETCEISQVLGRELGDHFVENYLEPRGHRHCHR